MKKFLTNHWKDILIIITAIFIFINIIAKCAAPYSLISEYVKFGPNIARHSSFSFSSAAENNSIVTGNNILDSIFTGEMMKICIIAAVALIGVCILSDFANKKSTAKKKK